MGPIVVSLILTLLVALGQTRTLHNRTADPDHDVTLSVDFYIPDGQWNMTAEGEYLARYGGRHSTRASYRSGSATRTHSCGHVRGVPGQLRSASVMKPNGLSSFYQKYTEAYGIPVLGSSALSDDALKRACYTLRFALADRADVRQSFYRMSGRVALIARSERTTQIPEHSYLDAAYWDTRARGLGATTGVPLSTGAEENVLCDPLSSDPWHKEDIFLHELSHGLDNLGASQVISGWTSRKEASFAAAKAAGHWGNTYAGSNPTEYFAEGVVTYHNVQEEAIPTDGVHNNINTRTELYSYDQTLYGLIYELFPCGNTYIKRCRKDRGAELSQQLRMDCGGSSGGVSGGTGTQIAGGSGGCVDDDSNCQYWASTGECTGGYAAYMKLHCLHSCNLCSSASSGSGSCSDKSENCGYWAGTGECSNNPAYMTANCRRSCNSCGGAIGR